MFKRILIRGVAAGIIAGLLSLAYRRIYQDALGADFSGIVSVTAIFSACMFGTVLAALGYWLLTRWLRHKGEMIFNCVLVLLSFISILGPFSMTLPLDMEFPELFPGLAVPMHFFPALAWFALRPLFSRDHSAVPDR